MEGNLQFPGQCGLYSETLSQNKTNLGHPFMELNLDISLQLCTYLLVFLTPISLSLTHTHIHTHMHTLNSFGSIVTASATSNFGDFLFIVVKYM